MVQPAELEMLRDSARRLVANARPDRWSSSGQTGLSDAALWSQMAQEGWLSAGLDVSRGGYGYGPAEAAVLAEEAGCGLLREPLIPHLVAIRLLQAVAPEELAGPVLEAVTSGRQKVTLAYAEPGSRYEWRLPRAVLRSSDDGALLAGSKIVVLGGGDADLFLATASNEAGDFALVLVPSLAAGVTARSYSLVDGTGAADVVFSDVRLSAEAILATGEFASAAFEAALDYAAVLACSAAVGAMRTAFESTLDYVKQRVQFGEPIGRNQALQHRLVDLLRMRRESEILLSDAVAALDGELREQQLSTSAAKIQISAAARKIGQEAVQMHGAIGTTDEAAISHYFRALMTLGSLFGDDHHHRTRFARIDASASTLGYGLAVAEAA